MTDGATDQVVAVDGYCFGYYRRPVYSLAKVKITYTLFFDKNVVFSAQAEYSYFSADFRLKIFLYYS